VITISEAQASLGILPLYLKIGSKVHNSTREYRPWN